MIEDKIFWFSMGILAAQLVDYILKHYCYCGAKYFNGRYTFSGGVHAANLIGKVT